MKEELVEVYSGVQLFPRDFLYTFTPSKMKESPFEIACVGKLKTKTLRGVEGAASASGGDEGRILGEELANDQITNIQ